MSESDDRVFGEVATELLLDNDQVRVWELQLEPGESSDLHHHRNDYVMVQIAGDRVAARFEPDSEGTFAGAGYLDGDVTPGAAYFARAGGRETAINIGDATFHEVVVELKSIRRRGMLPVQHLSLSVVDLAAALDFYTDILGLEQLERPDFGVPGAWLTTGNGIEIHLLEDANFVAPSGPHVAFETRNMAGEIDRLRSLGVDVNDAFELNGALQTFFSDPSGNQFELNQPAADH